MSEKLSALERLANRPQHPSEAPRIRMEQQEKQLELLERIAVALEAIANTKHPGVTP